MSGALNQLHLNEQIGLKHHPHRSNSAQVANALVVAFNSHPPEPSSKSISRNANQTINEAPRMSTIASPRDPSTPLRRPPLSPAASSRASLDSSTGHPPHPLPSPNPASAAASPGPNPSSGTPKRANRAALREYYNLKRAAAAVAAEQQQRGENNALGGGGGSEVPHSELDGKDFSAEEYVRRSLSESGLEELLRLYTRVLGEIRALDAEKKGLVYDNYSKLITATETIRKVNAQIPLAYGFIFSLLTPVSGCP